MGVTWEVREYDQEFFAKELNSFVPEKMFDAHAHLYKLSHWGRPTSVDQGPSEVTLEEFRRQMEWLTPGRETAGLFFGVGFHEGFGASNQFVSEQVSKDSDCRGELLVPPSMDPEEMRQEVKRLGFSGIKVYHTFITSKPSWHADVCEVLIEEHVRIAHEEGWVITLHMVKDRAMADPSNQERIQYYCRKYPNMKLILAHAARGFNPFHTIEGIHVLKGLRNVWCDVSAVTESGGFEAVMENLGYDRLLWGSDYPVSHQRGRCVAIGDQFLWLYEDTVNWETIASYTRIQPLFVGHESLRALKLTAQRLRLTDAQIEDIFYHNARNMLGM
jgi:glutamate-1-semialdehyde 2,1-aminomutase